MEKPPGTNDRVQITRAVFDGLESIRSSGATNMLDRPTVLHLAREWDFPETADWIESVDTGTYGRLILQRPGIIEDDRVDQQIETDPDDQDNEPSPADAVDGDEAFDKTHDFDVTEMVMDHVRESMRDLLATLGKHAIFTIAETYETQRMGVLVNPSHNDLITRERDVLIRNLGHASSLWLQLDAAMSEVQRGIGSLQYLIDPENN